MGAWEIAETEPTDPSPDEFFDFVADSKKHPANLAIDALPQNNAETRRFDGMDQIDPRALAVEHDALL